MVTALGPLVEAVRGWASRAGGLPAEVRAAYLDAVQALGPGESPEWMDAAVEEYSAMQPTPHELGARRAREGVQEVYVHADGCAGLPPDSPVQEGDKPVCRIAWTEDAGDMTVGIWPQSYWSLAPDQSGTLLGDVFAPPAVAAGVPVQSLTMTPVTVGLPPYGTGERVLVYTEGVEFHGEQWFDIKADDLYPDFDGDADARSEVAAAATHWAYRPVPTSDTPPSPCVDDERDAK